MRDKSTKHVSLRRREQAHERVQPEAPIQPKVFEEPEAPFDLEASAQIIEEVGTKSINSLETKSNQGDDMVTKRTMSISRFMLGTRPTM